MTDHKVFKTYSFYDNKGRRMALFCKRVDENNVEIATIVCSKKDQFNKAVANKMYNDPEVKKNTVLMPTKIGSNIGKEFISYCRSNYRVVVSEIVERKKLIKQRV